MSVVQLTDHFTPEEMTFSETAIRHGLPNVPGPDELLNLQALCKHVLEPARAALGPIHVNSGFRSPAVNALVGGAPGSQHTKGQAGDLRPLVATLHELLVWLWENAPFDQLIWEFGAWVHVSYDRREPGRHQLLAAFRKPGHGTLYRLVDSPAAAIALVRAA